jgi:hypothetical protein
VRVNLLISCYGFNARNRAPIASTRARRLTDRVSTFETKRCNTTTGTYPKGNAVSTLLDEFVVRVFRDT